MSAVGYIMYGTIGMFCLLSLIWLCAYGFAILDGWIDKIKSKHGVLGVIVFLSLLFGTILGFITYVLTEALMKGLK